ncbi:MAG: acetylxylan esterase [Chloroflexi bacterium]|nr:acetylxylan esterase [Chloroflexota bacterium]
MDRNENTIGGTLDSQFRPLAWYEALYAGEVRRFASPTTADPALWESWRVAFREPLRQRLALPASEPSPPVFTVAPPTTLAGYRRVYLEYASAPDTIVPAWLLIPDDLTGPAPAVIAVHGHGSGMDDLVGLNADGSERTEPQGYHQDFALALCRRGMIVLAPELRGFGRRREPQDQAAGPTNSSCHAAAWWGILLGKPLLGSRVGDVLRGIDLLQSLPEVDARRIGIMGGSGGGAVALFAAALDQRLRAAVISNYFCIFKASILAMQHCACNYLPGLLQDAEIYDVAALIAPRPLLIEAGTDDPIFPLHGVLAAYEHLHESYALQGAARQLDRDVFVGGHQISGAHSYAWLARALQSDS